LHVFPERGTEDCFLCLPPGAGYALIDPLPTDYDLRGRGLLVRRETKAPTSPLIVALDPNYRQERQLIEEKFPGDYMEKLFHKVLHLTRPLAG
jgi:hypothetical protein